MLDKLVDRCRDILRLQCILYIRIYIHLLVRYANIKSTMSVSTWVVNLAGRNIYLLHTPVAGGKRHDIEWPNVYAQQITVHA